MKAFAIFISLIFSLLSSSAIGQCCTAGSPVGGDGSNDGLGKKDLRIYAAYRHSMSKDYFHNDSKIDLPYFDKSYFDYSNLSLTYGLFKNISIHSELGYFIDKTQLVNINNVKDTIQSSGLGDLAFNVRWIAKNTVKPASQLVLSLGTKIPVGSFNEDINGVTIPVSLQPSSGALKYNAAAYYFRLRPDKKFGWQSFLFAEVSQFIRKGYLVYKYGNYYQFLLAANYAVIPELKLVAGAKYELRGKDTRENSLLVESSGGSVLYFSPQLLYDFKNKWSVMLMSDIPVYKYVNGYQLTNKFSIQLGLRKSFSFCKKAE